MKPRRCNSSALMLRQEFFKKWIKGLRIYSSNFHNGMTSSERKKAIKLSADVAIASTKNVGTHWSQALMAGVSSGGGAAAKILVQQIWGRTITCCCCCSNKIVRRSHRRRRRRVVVRSKSSSIAKKLVRINRTRVLKRLVPGGQHMKDEVSLIKETLDYIASLQLQVDVMRRLAAAAGDHPQQS